MTSSHRFILCLQLLLSSFAVAAEVVGLEWKRTPPPGLKVGDLVFRKGRGMWTKYFIGASTREKRFSHVGIVVRTDPSTFIVHSEGSDLTGIGNVRIEGWQGFMEIASECAVYRFAGAEETGRAIASCGLRRLGVRFDSSFDMFSTNELYCTEFIREAVNEAAGTNVVGFTIRKGRGIITLDDIYHRGFFKTFDSRQTPQVPLN